MEQIKGGIAKFDPLELFQTAGVTAANKLMKMILFFFFFFFFLIKHLKRKFIRTLNPEADIL